MNKAFFFIGLSGVGKTTLANLFIDYLLKNTELKPIFFDGNHMNDFNILKPADGLDLESRFLRAKHLSSIVNWSIDLGYTPVVAVIGQPVSAMKYWRKHIKNYYEVYLEADLKNCIERDFKSVYKSKKNVIGQDIKFEKPKNYDLKLDAREASPEDLLEILIDSL